MSHEDAAFGTERILSNGVIIGNFSMHFVKGMLTSSKYPDPYAYRVEYRANNLKKEGAYTFFVNFSRGNPNLKVTFFQLMARTNGEDKPKFSLESWGTNLYALRVYKGKTYGGGSKIYTFQGPSNFTSFKITTVLSKQNDAITTVESNINTPNYKMIKTEKDYMLWGNTEYFYWKTGQYRNLKQIAGTTNTQLTSKRAGNQLISFDGQSKTDIIIIPPK